MTIEEINKWLDNEYGYSYTKLEELHDFYFEKYCDLKKENQELKLELSGYRQAILKDKEMLGLKEENKKYKNQQKEFIEYLEDYLKLFDKMDIDAKISYDMLEEILQKYKEIIGANNAKKME